MIWLGHSSVIVEFEGKRFIFDPVFSNRAFAFQWIGPKRFHPSPITVENLPHLDGVIISHDHMDHLDYGTITQLSKRALKFYIPLGIGETLEHWGVKKEDIIEFNWWDTRKDDNVEFMAVPARHFSGRGLFDRDKTLWCT